MPDQFYADSTAVTLGEKFSTDFRFLREASVSALVTYLQAGPTFRTQYVNNNASAPKVWAYKCGPHEIRNTFASNTSAYPTNTVTEVAL